MTVEQTVEIPASHRLTIEVPREIPAGAKARFEVIWHTPEEDAPEAPPQSATPLSDSLLGILSDLGDISLEEIREERRARKYGL
ncbi:MAG: hypothetical protein LBG84_09875 [Treponema sp.]|jgi:hypothetical protein|nr:hypothetical protein [Treponema sp.]